MGADALMQIAGMTPTGSQPYRIEVRAASQPGIHPAGVVHLTNGSSGMMLFAKVRKQGYSGAQSLERELHYLSDVTPLIAAQDPRLRAPRPVAYCPHSGLLLMEFVPGRSLKQHLFGVSNVRAQGGSAMLADSLRSAGRWLGYLHRLTRQSACGNPLEWLLQEFDQMRTAEAYGLYSLTGAYREMLSLLESCLARNPNFRRKLCSVHGEFTPLHVIRAHDAIYVIDFGNSAAGYPYGDLSLFTTFYDCLLPWRAAIASRPLRLELQKNLFLSGYFERSGSVFTDADNAIMRWARMISFARTLSERQRRYTRWKNKAFAWVTVGALRQRFTAACNAELRELRKLPVDIFDQQGPLDPPPARPPSAEVSEAARTSDLTTC
jgi:aminoglycoside phosphotransferase (APT) family kinase protein